jgi:rhamnose utilization protein RhaD (predicted bifunctional aldolase and dehydrogenase)/NAD(P)-dependent dehydrogenase (short-subunit alcohol dehydrogenase family)
MDSLWSDSEAAAFIERLAPRWGEALALRVYTSRLIGRDADLVMHGGGNTSVKGTVTTLLGDRIEALFVKGSGWDLDSIEPPGFPALDLAYLRRLRGLDRLDDVEMVNQLRTHLFEAGAPTPSVETLLHAFLPHRFIDHTHADIALVLTNQPPGVAEQMVREALGPRWALVPYVMPGLHLAKATADAFDVAPDCEGIVMLNHGLVSFADDARTAYERMIIAVDRAERFVRARLSGRAPASAPRALGLSAGAAAAALAPALRGALARRVAGDGDAARPPRASIVAYRATDEILGLLERPDAAALAATNPLTPDHVIRTKGPALFLEEPLPWGDTPALGARLADEVAAYRARYQQYFDAGRARAGGAVARLDPSPRVLLAPGVGLFTTGPTRAEADVAADIAEHTLRAKAAAADLGRYAALSDADLFAMEYWSLEQAKLGKGSPPPLGGQVALVTGGAGAIGFGVCRALAAAGAHVVVADVDPAGVARAVREIDPKGRRLAHGLVLDVTREADVDAALDEICRVYGGLDVLVLNAGVAHVARIEELAADELRRVMDINFMGYFLVLRAAARLFRRQGTGGNVVVNSSKNVFAPGAEFGAYSASKAAGHQLGKVAALELAPLGVRVNMLNVDAVFGDAARPSGLWQHVGPERARARGLEPAALPDFYRQRNLLKAAVTAEHVGNAVVFFATNQTPTTGATLPIDGGIPEGFPR